MEFKLESKPFSWNDNFSEDAMEVLAGVHLGYVSHQLLGIALAKLQILEQQGAKVDESKLKEQE